MSVSVSATNPRTAYRKNARTGQVCRTRALIFLPHLQWPMPSWLHEWQVLSLCLVIQNRITFHEFVPFFLIWHEILLVKDITKWWIEIYRQCIHMTWTTTGWFYLNSPSSCIERCNKQHCPFTFSVLQTILQIFVIFPCSFPYSKLRVLLYLTSLQTYMYLHTLDLVSFPYCTLVCSARV